MEEHFNLTNIFFFFKFLLQHQYILIYFLKLNFISQFTFLYMYKITVKQNIRKEMFYLMMHSTHFIYGYMASDIW